MRDEAKVHVHAKKIFSPSFPKFSAESVQLCGLSQKTVVAKTWVFCEKK